MKNIGPKFDYEHYNYDFRDGHWVPIELPPAMWKQEKAGHYNLDLIVRKATETLADIRSKIHELQKKPTYTTKELQAELMKLMEPALESKLFLEGLKEFLIQKIDVQRDVKIQKIGGIFRNAQARFAANDAELAKTRINNTFTSLIEEFEKIPVEALAILPRK